MRDLAVRRSKPSPIPTSRELMVGKKAMNKVEGKIRTRLEVTLMFEPSRLAAEYLADAYAQVIPVRKWSKRRRRDQSPESHDLSAEDRREKT